MEFNATFIVAFVSFIIFTVIMNLILYKPLSKIVMERQKFIDDNYKEAKLKHEKSEAILRDKERKFEKTKHDAKTIIAEKVAETKNQKAVMTSSAQQKVGATIDEAKENLQAEKLGAQDVLSNQVVNLAQDISSKILGENVSIQNVDSDLVKKIMSEG